MLFWKAQFKKGIALLNIIYHLMLACVRWYNTPVWWQTTLTQFWHVWEWATSHVQMPSMAMLHKILYSCRYYPKSTAYGRLIHEAAAAACPGESEATWHTSTCYPHTFKFTWFIVMYVMGFAEITPSTMRIIKPRFTSYTAPQHVIRVSFCNTYMRTEIFAIN